MTEILLNPITQKQIHSFIMNPTHALGIYGPTGIGKTHLVQYIIDELEKSQKNSIRRLYIELDNNDSSGIDKIRSINNYVKIKVNSEKIHQVVIIKNLELFSVPAQNALLKNLEEPPRGTTIIISATSKTSILPTIASRAQTIEIKLPPEQTIKSFYIKKGFNESDVNKTFLMSGGLPGLMNSLLGAEQHDLLDATEIVKKLLSSTPYDRLMYLDGMSKDRNLLSAVLTVLMYMARAALKGPSTTNTNKWQHIMELSYECHDLLDNNASTKLIIDKIALSI